jgi:hypothetical protein
MEIPHRGARPTALPEIYVHDPSERFRTSSRSSSYNSTSSLATSAMAMSIPNAREAPPPPLPPPRHLADIADGGHNGQDIAWKWGNSQDDRSDWGRSTPSSIAPGSSLHGGSFSSGRGFMEDRPEYTRRTSSVATVKSPDARETSYQRDQRDEGYASLLSGTSVWSNKSVCDSFAMRFRDHRAARSTKYIFLFVPVIVRWHPDLLSEFTICTACFK